MNTCKLIGIAISIFLISCSQEEYVNEKCLGITPIANTLKLKTGDTLPGFTGYTNKGTRFSSNDFNKKTYLYFLKRKNIHQGGY